MKDHLAQNLFSYDRRRQEVPMKKVKNKLAAILNAITFAEAGEHHTAQEFLDESSALTESDVVESRKELELGQELRSHPYTFERQLAATAFAEAADFETALELAGPAERPRTVLLVIEGNAPDQAAFSYALSLCKRMNLRMDILQTVPASEAKRDSRPLGKQGDAVSRELKGLLRRLEQEGVPFRVTVLRGDVNERLCDYTVVHKSVIMIVYDSPKVRDDHMKSRGWERVFDSISRRLAVPLVRVEEKEPLGQPS
jgi:hypothetical protein